MCFRFQLHPPFWICLKLFLTCRSRVAFERNETLRDWVSKAPCPSEDVFRNLNSFILFNLLSSIVSLICMRACVRAGARKKSKTNRKNYRLHWVDVISEEKRGNCCVFIRLDIHAHANTYIIRNSWLNIRV